MTYAGSLVTKLWEFSGDRAAAQSPIHPTYQIPQGLRRACAGIWTETLRRILPYGPSLATVAVGSAVRRTTQLSSSVLLPTFEGSRWDLNFRKSRAKRVVPAHLTSKTRFAKNGHFPPIQSVSNALAPRKPFGFGADI